MTSADLDQNFQPINDSFPAKVAGTHIVQRNETLQCIAAAMYGDASLWYLIADANGLTVTRRTTGEGHVLYGKRLQDGQAYFEDHQKGPVRFGLDRFRTEYLPIRSIYLKPTEYVIYEQY